MTSLRLEILGPTLKAKEELEETIKNQRQEIEKIKSQFNQLRQKYQGLNNQGTELQTENQGLKQQIQRSEVNIVLVPLFVIVFSDILYS